MVKKDDPLELRKASNYDYTGVERRKRHLKKMKAMGFLRKEVLVHEDDWHVVQELVHTLRDKRFKDLK